MNHLDSRSGVRVSVDFSIQIVYIVIVLNDGWLVG